MIVRKLLLACSATLVGSLAVGGFAASGAMAQSAAPALARAVTPVPLPSVLNSGEQRHYRQLFAAIDEGRWVDVQTLLDTGPEKYLNDYARAEYYLAANSPKVELDALMSLLTRQPNLPQAAQLAKLAQKRGATTLPSLPSEQRFAYLGEAPRRVFNLQTTPDPVAASVSNQILSLIKNDDPAGAETVLNGVIGGMSPAAQTEWQYRIAWSYYIENDDGNARRLAETASRGTGNWVAQANWAGGLAAWRQGDYASATAKFSLLPTLTSDQELQAAGHYWAARALVASGQPQQAGARLKSAMRLGETFYGLLATEALGVSPATQVNRQGADRNSLRRLQDQTNVRTAIALKEIDQTARADATLRYQARIGQAGDYPALIALARAMSLPSTQMYLAHYGPSGAPTDKFARYPAPDWQPEGGWRVDRSLVYAHALQESQFRTAVVSPAGATGLMQVRPGTAQDIARTRGITLRNGDLTKPSINMEYGQSYMEYLRDNGATGGLLPKVIAAYNAGPNPVARWNSEVRDNNDPLLFIESIPYWETRGYVGIVLRNYWMYQQQAGQSSRSMVEMAQGKWPKFPTMQTRTASNVSNTDIYTDYGESAHGSSN